MPLLQIQEPSAKENSQNNAADIVVGIDLGTTNSLVGVVEDNLVKLFADKNGNELHPSIVAFDEAGSINSVGFEAIEALAKNKNITIISSIKRLMGKGFSDIKNHQFQLEQNPQNLESVRLVIGNKKYSPEEISAEILKYLKNLAEKKLNISVKKAVITVPAYFDEAAKNATKLAAKLAKLEVLRLVNEPTAAALAYGLDNNSEGTYAIYDLGGGTFDVSILKMQQGIFKVLGVSGDNALGGDDFDEILAKKILEKSKINFSDAKILAKKVKENLSFNDAFELDLSSLGSNNKILFTRQEFENLIAEKINKTISLTIKLIEDLNLETVDIKGLVMVGGSSRIGLIHKKLGEIFGKNKILTNLDCDRVVAIGAARQAFNLSGNVTQNLLLDVIPLSLGIEMMGGIVDKVIMRNSTIPTLATKEFTTYADNQTGMKFHIVQGEREFAKDCRSLAHFEIKNIPAMKAGIARVEVSFKVDADGLLTVSAKEKITGQIQEIIVKPTYGIDENEVKNMLLDSMQNAEQDMQNRLLVQTINEANQNIKILRDDLEILSDLISADEKKIILEKILALEDAIKTLQSRDLIESAIKELEQASQNFILQKVNLSLKKFI